MPSLCDWSLWSIVAGSVIAAKAPSQEYSPPECLPSTFTNGLKSRAVGSGFEILSVTASPQHDFTSIKGGPLQPALSGLNFCQVKVHITHLDTNDNDRVLVEVWLPMTHDDWNGRFQATGGAGFETGMFGAHLGRAVQDGWAAVSTDGGSGSDNLSQVSNVAWALKDRNDGTLNWNLLHNFASRSLVDQITIGKSVTEQFYGKAPHHSYWNGCSTGGRQGYMIAQKHPHLLDGILAEAPAFNFVNLVTSEFWPQLLMKQHTYVSNCEFEYFRSQAIDKCDMDGVRDGIIEDPESCDFDPFAIVGDEIQCDGKHIDITLEMATVVDHIIKGPKQVPWGPIFPGQSPGNSFERLSNISIAGDGTRSQNPFGICETWMKNIILRNPSARLEHLDVTSYFGLWAQANYELGGLLNTADPDLSALQASGTKLLTWHGKEDSSIPYQNTVDYRRKVEGVMGGAHAVDQFYRLFLAPGLDHCGGGIGPVPHDPMGALIDWVEKDEPPEVLEAKTINFKDELVTRELCAFPGKSKYMSIGDPNRASSWSCVGGTERPETDFQDQASERTGEILGGLAARLEDLGLGLSIGGAF